MSDDSEEFSRNVRANQHQLRTNLKSHYDFIVCGSGSSGSVVARRLAENVDVSVLLLEAGGNDDHPNVLEAAQWAMNIAATGTGIGRRTEPASQRPCSSHVDGEGARRGFKHQRHDLGSWAPDRLGLFRISGRRSSLELRVCSEDLSSDRGLARDCRSEDRGSGGMLFVQPASALSPIVPALLEGCRSNGIPVFAHQNGPMMESKSGASVIDTRVRDGKRQSIFRSYVFPYMDRPNLTVLTRATVDRIVFDGKRAVGVEVSYGGARHRINAARRSLSPWVHAIRRSFSCSPVSEIRPNWGASVSQ